MKRKTAKEILVDSFRELAREKPIDRITVKDITANCGYSQATFYRQFKDKYDLIAWAYSRDLEAILTPVADGSHPWRQTLLQGAAYYQEHREYLSNLLLHTSGYDSFVSNMTEINSRGLRETILKRTGRETLDLTTEMYIRLYCAGTVQLTCEWILGRYPVSIEQLAEVYENALPDPLKQYLLQE